MVPNFLRMLILASVRNKYHDLFMHPFKVISAFELEILRFYLLRNEGLIFINQ